MFGRRAKASGVSLEYTLANTLRAVYFGGAALERKISTGFKSVSARSYQQASHLDCDVRAIHIHWRVGYWVQSFSKDGLLHGMMFVCPAMRYIVCLESE